MAGKGQGGSGGLGCGMKMLKVMMIIFNIIVLLVGIILLALGLWAMFGSQAWKDKLKEALWDPNTVAVTGSEVSTGEDAYNLAETILSDLAIGIAVFGGVLVILGGLAFVGACCQKRALLVIYAVLVGMILLAQVIVGALVFVYKDQAEETIQGGLLTSLKENFNGTYLTGCGGTSGYDFAFTSIMIGFDCCGVNNESDFDSDTLWWNQERMCWRYNTGSEMYPTWNYPAYPVACCKFDAGGQDVTDKDVTFWTDFQVDWMGNTLPSGCPKTDTSINKNVGCYSKVKSDLLDKYTIPVGATAIAIVVIELFAIIVSCCLCSAIGKDKDDD